MFDNLSERLSKTIRNLRGQGRLSEDNIRDALRDVRMALLEADVALPVVKEFIDRVRERALGQDVLKSLTPGQTLVKVVSDELVHMMGDANDALASERAAARRDPDGRPAGFRQDHQQRQAGAHAAWQREKKTVLLASCDIYRPAAIDQLQTLANEVGAVFFPSRADQDPVTIASDAVAHARKQHIDVVIVDTAGRLHIDDEMMAGDPPRARGDRPGGDAVRGRQHDRPGCRQYGAHLQRGPAADRRGAHQDRWRRPWRCGAVDSLDHRQADQVHRRGRENGGAGAVLSRIAWPRAFSAWATC